MPYGYYGDLGGSPAGGQDRSRAELQGKNESNALIWLPLPLEGEGWGEGERESLLVIPTARGPHPALWGGDRVGLSVALPKEGATP